MRGEAIATNIDTANIAGAPKLLGASMWGDKVSEQECSEEHRRIPVVAAGPQAGEKAMLAVGDRGEVAASTTGSLASQRGQVDKRLGQGWGRPILL